MTAGEWSRMDRRGRRDRQWTAEQVFRGGLTEWRKLKLHGRRVLRWAVVIEETSEYERPEKPE